MRSDNTSLASIRKLDIAHLQEHARRVRAKVVRMAHDGKTPHVASALSSVDLLVALYFAVMRITPEESGTDGRDRFILSKGHGCMALYATLAERGFFSAQLLQEYACDGGRLAEHPTPGCVRGLEAGTGSLGHGLALGAGLALASKIRQNGARTFVLMSDGECQEGSVWETALFAPVHNLDNLTTIIDYNGWSALGRTRPCLDPLIDKWRAFGWGACEIDGHDLDAICSNLASLPLEKGRPSAVIAHTTKGKGVSFMEDDLEWHYRPPSAEDLRAALAEIGDGV